MRLAAVFVSTVSLAACVTIRTTPVTDALFLVKVGSRNTRSETKSGVTVTVRAINVPELPQKEPIFCWPMAVAVCRPETVTTPIVYVQAGGGPGANNPNVVQACAPLADLVFAITVENQTSHSLDLSSSVLQLEDGSGESYEPLPDGAVCAGKATRIDNTKRNPKAWPGTIRVLPGKRRTGTAAFCLQDRTPRFPGRLLIYDVPVDTDEAGVVTKRENFSFPLEGEVVDHYLTFGPGRTLAYASDPPVCWHYDANGWFRERGRRPRRAAGANDDLGPSRAAQRAPKIAVKGDQSGLPEAARGAARAVEHALAHEQANLLGSCWRTYGQGQGAVLLKLTLDPSGRVTSAEADASGSFGNCLERVAKTIPFPAFTGAAVTYEVVVTAVGK